MAKRLNLSFSPAFIIFGFLVIYFGFIYEFFVYVVVMILHESAHYVCARCYGYRLNKILFMPYGAGISGDSNLFLPTHEMVIALAGPVLNLFLVLLTVVFWWLMPMTYAYTQEFLKANFVLGIFNLLPIFPLDGGRVFLAVFTQKNQRIKALKVMKIVGLSLSFVCAALFLFSVLWQVNVTFLFISLFLCFSSFQNMSDVYYERSYLKNFSGDKTKKPVEIKTYAVKATTPAYELVKFIRGQHYTQFALLNEKNQVIKIVTETQLLSALGLKEDKNS